MKKSLISALLLVTMLVVTLTLCSFSGDVSCTSADEDMMYTLTAAAGTDYSVAESTVGDYNFFRVRVNPNTAVNIPLNLAIAGQTEQEEWSFDESSNEPVTSALSVTDLTASFDGSGNTTDGATINIPASVEGTVYSFAFNFIISADVGAGLGERCTDTYRMVIEVEDSIDENRNLVYVINGYAENEAGDNILSADAGETITLAYSGPKNYEFSEWELRSEIPGFAFPEGSSETITFTMPDSDVVIEAQRNKLYDLIPVVDITDLTIPVLNATPDFDVTIPAGAHYHLARPQELVDYGYGDYVDTNHNGVWWSKQNAESDMETTGTFNDVTESYKFELLLIPNSGYSFTSDTSIIVNGEPALVSEKNINNQGALRIVSIDFSVDPAKIGFVSINDLTIPAYGATPDFDVTIPADAHYHLARPQELVDYGYGDYVDTNHNGVWWFRQHAESDMKTTDTFNDATESYKFDFLLISNSGYSFADNVVVTINGKSSLIGDYPYIDSEGSLYVISKDFSVTAPASDSKYTITSGGEITWTKGGTDGLLITSDAPFNRFVGVKVDDTLIDAANYTASEGGTKVVLKSSYLETFSVGNHKIEILSRAGDSANAKQISAETNFTVAQQETITPVNPEKNPTQPSKDTETPQTGDSSNMSLWIALAFFSMLGVAATIFGKKHLSTKRGK